MVKPRYHEQPSPSNEVIEAFPGGFGKLFMQPWCALICKSGQLWTSQ
jgi:hypothetical protein